MFDVTSRISYRSVPIWYKDLTRVCYSVPIVLCGNKVDCKERAVKPKDITFYRRVNIQYYDISAKSQYNFEKPFLYILRKLTGKLNLCLERAPALMPAEAEIDQNLMDQYAREHAEANTIALPPDEDDI